MVIIKYENESEVQSIIDEQTKKGLHLVSVSNVIEGNFLGFDDRDVVPQIPNVDSNQLTMKELQDNQLIIMSAIADLYSALQ